MVEQSNIFLIKPNDKFKSTFLKWLKEAHDEGTYLFWQQEQLEADFRKFVQEQLDKEIMCPIANVPETVYWAIQDQEMIGRISVRHRLNDKLKIRGGHIGYQISKNYRGKGLAKQILRLALLESKKTGLSKILLTTEQSNIASQKVIEANGGIQELIANSEPNLHYWISLSTLD